MSETKTATFQNLTEVVSGDSSHRWVGLVAQAQEMMGTRDINGAIKMMARGLAERAVSQEYGFSEQEMDTSERTLVETIGMVYTQVNQRVKKENIQVDSAFSRDVYLEVIPALLSVNRVSPDFNNTNGYNSVDQMVSTAIAFMKSPSLKGTDHRFIVFGQMCAQYDSGSAHESNSFTRGLLTDISHEKVHEMFTPVRRLTEVLRRHDIPTRIVTAQLSAEPMNMLAMVPATVWEYVTNRNVATMITLLDHHVHHLDSSIKTVLSVNGSAEYTHKTQSYSEHLGSDSESIMERTLRFADMYTEAFRQWQKQFSQNEDKVIKHWSDIEVKQLRDFFRYIDHDNNYERIMDATEISYRQRTNQEFSQDIFRLIHNTMRAPNWGTLDDTEKFYNREVSVRANGQASEWQHLLNRPIETTHLLEDSEFYPTHSEVERRQRAEELLDWVDTLANIGIGSRAVFNTALYASLGQEISAYNKAGDIAMMWPLEEDIDRFALDAMNKMYKLMLNGKGKDETIPCIYARKELRQPLK